MRYSVTTLVVLGSISTAAFGQTGPYMASVIEAGAQLYAGPGVQFPGTGTLRQGDSLLVDHEEPNGWLAVQDGPGKMYSMSWVQIQFVNFDPTKPTPQNVTVEDDVTLASGQIGVAHPLTTPLVQRAKIPAGTILTVIGPKTSFDGKSWYPVVPPSGDFRYIAKQLVHTEKSANTSYTIRDSSVSPLTALGQSGSIAQTGSNIPAQTGTGSSLPPPPAIGAPVSSNGTPPSTPAKPVVQNPLWTQAETAEKEGRLSDAESLYFQLAQQMNMPGGDHDIANLCYTQIHSLREKMKTGSKNVLTSSPKAVAGGNSTTQAKTVVTTDSVAGGGTANLRPGYIASGKLTHSAMWIDSQRTYCVETSEGVSQVYVVAVAGSPIDLERYLGKRVDVYGSSFTHTNVKKPVVVPTSLEVVQ